MAMPEYTPSCPAAGVPERRPEEVLKLAHDGLPLMENASVCPSGSDAEGWKTYCDPTVTLAEGDPEIVGARLPEPFTVTENAGSDALNAPSLTVTVIPEVVPALDG